jgi:hypothetical protein
MLKDNENMILKIRKPDQINEEMVDKINKFFKNRHCAYFVNIALITILDKDTYKELEKEHYCVIIKPTDKYSLDKDNFKVFEIMKPYLNDDSDFVDFSILGYYKTMQIYDKENVLNIY